MSVIHKPFRGGPLSGPPWRDGDLRWLGLSLCVVSALAVLLAVFGLLWQL